jgi:threonine synthase
MGIWRFAEWFGDVPNESRVSLGEGGTPLLQSRRIGPALGMPNLYFKLETTNPTGSYKDRFAFTAVSHMVAAGQRMCVATSSGNTGAALAAYCAAAGIRCEIAIVEGAPIGKLQQMLAYGANLYRVRGFGTDPQLSDDVFDHIRLRAQSSDAAVQISAFRFSPLGMSGVQTIAFELAEQLQKGIDHVFCPAGSGGLLVAAAQGFSKLVEVGRLARSPAIECVQPAGNDTIATPLREGAEAAQTITGTSLISGLQVPSIIDGTVALRACRRSGGSGHIVSDEEVWAMQRRLAREEGIFAEPAGATSVAGFARSVAEGRIEKRATVVCTITGSGFKDPQSIERLNGADRIPLVSIDEFRQQFAAA